MISRLFAAFVVVTALTGGLSHAAPPPDAPASPPVPSAPSGGPSAEASAPASAPTAPPATSPDALFHAANARYFAGDWRGAETAYTDLLTRFHVADPAVFHNLGNAAFRGGAYGRAVLAYQRALRLAPPAATADALRRNLDATRRVLQARYRVDSDTALVYADPSGVTYKITHLLGDTGISLIFAGLWVLLFVLLIVRHRARHLVWPGRTAVPVGILVLIAGALLVGRAQTDAATRIAVVTSASAQLRDGKHVAAQGRPVPEGLEVRVLDRDAAWTQVELPGGQRGWIADSEVEEI